MAYETDMVVVFDPIERSAVVSFRGSVVLLAGPFADRKQATAAGEAHCRRLGWVDGPRLPRMI